MLLKSLLISILLIFTACTENKPTKKYDGKKLLEQKCASCHNLEIPPYTFAEELAPPMMAVSFHIYDFTEATDDSQRLYKAQEFVVDYIRFPSAEKSFCDKESLESYGVMPSQKDKITVDEAKAVAKYMFKHFNQENLLKAQKAKREFDALPKGKKVALKHKCMGCHRVDKKIIGPSFKDVASKYTNSKDEMIKSIKDGSKAKWKSSNGAIMPPFKQINDEDLKILSEWIINL